MTQHDGVLDRVLRDFAGTVVMQASPSLILLDPDHIGDGATGLDDPRSWLDPRAPREKRLLLRIAANVTALDASSPPAGLEVEIASLLQDHVIDETGRPWPECDVPDVGMRILDPYPDGAAGVWGHRRSGVTVCRIGDLCRLVRS